MKNRPIIIAFKGFSNTGKTSSLESIVKFLTKRGKKVSVVKKIHIEEFSIDQSGKDTWKMRQSGAEPVVSFGKKEKAFLTSKDLSLNQTIQVVLGLRNDLDYLFLEGFWKNKYPKILFTKSLADFEDLIRKIMEDKRGNDILLSCLCLSGVFFDGSLAKQHTKKVLHSAIKKLYNKKIIDSSIFKHISGLPIIDIKHNPKEFMKLLEEM